MSFAYVNPPRLSLRGCSDTTSRFVGRGHLTSKWERRPPPVPPPSQTRCAGRSNTGRSLAAPAPHSHSARPARQLRSGPTLGFTAEQKEDKELEPSAPCWERYGPVSLHHHLHLSLSVSHPNHRSDIRTPECGGFLFLTQFSGGIWVRSR